MKRRALLVGGNGGRTSQYRACAASAGYEITHHERGALPDAGRLASPAVVLIITTAISHPLRKAAVELAKRAKAPIRYLSSATAEAVKRVLEAEDRIAKEGRDASLTLY